MPRPMQSTQTNHRHKYNMSNSGKWTMTPKLIVVKAKVDASSTRKAGSSRANWPFVVFLFFYFIDFRFNKNKLNLY